MTAATVMTTVDEAIAAAAERLDAAGIPRARFEARLLLGHVIGADQAWILGHPQAEITCKDRYDELVARRAGRMPLSRIVGSREFWSLDFLVTPDTLDPRPESETLVQALLDALPGDRREAPIELLDLGTGTGCLLLAALSELPEARGVGVDRSPGAVAVARQNAERLGVAARTAFLVADWGAALDRRFDGVLVNPPYVASVAIETLEPEVALFDPRQALDGGRDGLASYRRIAGELPHLLKPTGVAVLELGAGQCRAVSTIMAGRGIRVRQTIADLSGITRCLVCVAQ